jgi:hypothetical protein
MTKEKQGPADAMTSGHRVLDSLIGRYRSCLGNNLRMDSQYRQVLQLWELTAANTTTDDEAIKYLDGLYSLAIDHYRDNKPAAAAAWNLLARYRHRRVVWGLRAHLAAAHHADKYHFYMVKTYPQVIAYHLNQHQERQS